MWHWENIFVRKLAAKELSRSLQTWYSDSHKHEDDPSNSADKQFKVNFIFNFFAKGGISFYKHISLNPDHEV